jgi:hypothetical protein
VLQNYKNEKVSCNISQEKRNRRINLQKEGKFEVKIVSVKSGILKSFKSARYLTKKYFAFNKIAYYCSAKKLAIE